MSPPVDEDEAATEEGGEVVVHACMRLETRDTTQHWIVLYRIAGFLRRVLIFTFLQGKKQSCEN